MQKTEYNDQFLEHINSIDPQIQFSTEDPNSDGSLPFLDTLATPELDNTLLTAVYRRPTHTESTYIETASTSFLQQIMQITPSHTEQELFV